MFRRIVRRQARLRLAAVALAVPLVVTVGAVRVDAQSPDENSESAPTSASYTGPVSSANARFIVEGYQTLLGRQADTSGLDFHLARLAAGGATSRQAFTYSLLFSVEGSRGEVTRAYDDLLDRAPDTEGHAYWTDHLQGRSVLDLRVLLLSSDEYHNGAGGNDQAWIEALYDDVLDRGADPSGLSYWLERAGAGVPRALIAASIYQSDEALAQRAVAHYQEVLSRSPSTAERSAAVDTIRQAGERVLRAQLLASDEAYEDYLQAALS
ncbi:MAG: DUF4214 domain-containing protein [Actinomycetota bacterium]